MVCVCVSVFMCQILSKEQYACWLQRHLEAETAIQGREELLFESALRLETNLQLLGICSIYSFILNLPKRRSIRTALAAGIIL